LTLTASAGATLGTSTVTITGTSGSLTSTTTVSLTVTGNGPVVTLTPTSLKWAKIFVGVKSASKAVTLTNSGSSTLNISNIAVSGDFAQKIVARSCGATVAAGASCVIRVTFTPTQVGVRTGTLSITDNAPGSPQTVSLSGTGK